MNTSTLVGRGARGKYEYKPLSGEQATVSISKLFVVFGIRLVDAYNLFTFVALFTSVFLNTRLSTSWMFQ